MIGKVAQEPKDVWFVQTIPDPSKIISVDSGLYKSAIKEAHGFLDFLTEVNNRGEAKEKQKRSRREERRREESRKERRRERRSHYTHQQGSL
jgi:hypothetical protein